MNTSSNPLSSGTHAHHNTTAGPHASNMMNRADPRVDSDRDHRAAPGGLTGGLTGNSGAYTTSNNYTTGPASTTAGPHTSNIANKADPRVDSDRDGRGLGHGVTGTGMTNTHGTTGLHSGVAPTTAGHGTTEAGLSSTHGTHGTTGLSSGPAHTTAGPHRSDMANKADPRVDSDRDGRGMGATGMTGTHGTTGAGLTGTHATHGTTGLSSGPAPTTAGPHRSDMANKADPRVDSDRDGRGSIGSGTHGPGLSTSSAMNPPVLPSASTSGSSTRFSESTAAKTQGLLGGSSSETHGGLMGGRSAMDSIAPSSRNDGVTGRHGSTGHGTGVSPQAAAREADRHAQLEKEELGLGTTGTTGTTGMTGTHGTTSLSSGPASMTAGPHSSNIANKADPRVDSDMDGRGLGHGTTAAGMTGTHGTHGVSAGRTDGVATRDTAVGAGRTNATAGTGTAPVNQRYDNLLASEETANTMSPSKTRSGAAYATQPGSQPGAI